MASNPPALCLIPRHQIQLRRTGFLLKFLNLLCDSHNHCSHLQCCWKSQVVDREERGVYLLVSYVFMLAGCSAGFDFGICEFEVVINRSSRRDVLGFLLGLPAIV